MDDQIYDITSDPFQDQNLNNPGNVPTANSGTSQGDGQKREPDSATVDRIRNLGIVGTALMERANDNSFQTDYLLAKESLQKFKAGIDRLNLDPTAAKGMANLVDYLQTKIEKRLRSNIEMKALE